MDTPEKNVLRLSTGTLLNRLFGTTFDVMDESKRQQTTKGMAVSANTTSFLTLVHRYLDVPWQVNECHGHGR
jgi:hypothetical protein